MTVGKGDRPKDPNQLAKWIVEKSTEENPTALEPSADVSSRADISAYMSKIGRKGGQIGGKRRLKTMTKEQRKKIASRADKTRWKAVKKSKQP